jgi:Kef-type K+ transport system membrane component KefB
MMVALALTTTALGVLLPILRDAGELETDFGHLVLAVGTVGEFGPIVVMSLVLTGTYSGWLDIGLMLAFVAIAFGAALVALGARPPKVLALLRRTMESSSQLPVRISLLLLAAFVVLSEQLGFDAVPGAFAAGMVVGLATRGTEGTGLRLKIEAVCFGFLVPFFYVTSGIKFDLAAVVQNPMTMLLVPVFLVLMLVVRGTGVLLYRGVLSPGERLPFALYAATGLPLVVAVVEVGVRTGTMRTAIAAALVGAGMLSVLLFPTIAGVLLLRGSRTTTRATP